MLSELVLSLFLATKVALDLTLDIALCDGLALVLATLAFGERNLNFHATVFEIDRQRHDGESFARYALSECLDLRRVKQQFARAVRVVRANSMCELIRRNMHTFEPEFAVVNARVRIGELNLTGAQAFHFAAGQHDARFEHLEDAEVVTGLAVAGQGGRLFLG